MNWSDLQRKVDEPTAIAAFDSDCPGGCGDEILVDDRIILIDGEWVCEHCADG